MEEAVRILVVDDDKELLLSCEKILRNNGAYDVVAMHDSSEAMNEVESGNYDLIISDLSMPEVSGLDLLRRSRVKAPETPFVIFTAYGNVETAVEIMREGAFDFIEKPFKSARLKVVVEKSLQLRNLHKEKRVLENQLRGTYSYNDIVGKSASIRRVFEMISRVADGDSNITIIGESGTGKELVARAIHADSGRKSNSFVPVNCGAFPENLFESELFGYEKGAFTGAYRRKPGLLEFADSGTFFLDEICELSPTLQAKLLRTLQDGKFRRVGGTELIEVDVRIISASNRNLEKAMSDGSLREDLYYRLNVISIQLPALRDRRDDIAILCKHFIEKYSKCTSKNIKGVAEKASHCLEKYRWPGNVRELENVIERAITLATDEWIQVRDLPEKIVCAEAAPATLHMELPLKEAKATMVAGFEQEYLTKMLARHDGIITQAALKSGVDRRTFHRLIKRYQLNAKPKNNN